MNCGLLFSLLTEAWGIWKLCYGIIQRFGSDVCFSVRALCLGFWEHLWWSAVTALMSLSLFVYDSFCSCVMPKTQHALFPAYPKKNFPEKNPQVTGCLHGKVHVKASINCLQVAPHDPVLNEQERQMLQIFHFKSWRISKNISLL